MVKKLLLVILLGTALFLSGCIEGQLTGGPGRPPGGSMERPNGGPPNMQGKEGFNGGPPDMAQGKRQGLADILDSIVDDLELTDKQEVKYEELKSNLQERMERQLRNSTDEELMSEMKKDKPDINMIIIKGKKNIDVEAKNTKESIDLFANFYNILDENQKNIFIEKIQEKIGEVNRVNSPPPDRR
jgi:Spy/CpxP family protein refolding chaperone